VQRQLEVDRLRALATGEGADVGDGQADVLLRRAVIDVLRGGVAGFDGRGAEVVVAGLLAGHELGLERRARGVDAVPRLLAGFVVGGLTVGAQGLVLRLQEAHEVGGVGHGGYSSAVGVTDGLRRFRL
jgi:hypothetical protein